jgi:hypothetical protein
MAFLNIPLKSIQAFVVTSVGTETMPWDNPLLYPVIPPALPPTPDQKDFRWRVTMEIDLQSHSSSITRQPGEYSGLDISVGQWIANTTTGQAWQIISIESKSSSSIIAIVQDVYRYNTFRDQTKTGNGSLATATYIVFSIGDNGLPQIDPIPPGGVSASFTQNITSRFEYINLQYDYPLFQASNTFQVNDVIAADASTNSFVLSDATNKLVIGRVTSVSDILPGWFTINPVQKVVDFLDYLPGGIADLVYTSTTVPGDVTTVAGGVEIYINLREQTSSVTVSELPGPTTSGNIFQVNGVDVTVGGTGSLINTVTAINLSTINTGVSALSVSAPSSVRTDILLVTATYGEPVLYAISSPSVATINGISVTFNITSSDPGYEDYARAAQMAQSINNAAIPDIIAYTDGILVLVVENTAGGAITIVNITDDINTVPVAGTDSGTGLALFTPASTTNLIQCTAVDARAINFLDVVGLTVSDFGLVSVENGVKAAGLYIQSGLRTANTTVVTTLTQLNALTPLVGDQAYVINSDDSSGNNVSEWSLWLYDGLNWVQTSNQDSSETDAKSLEYTLTFATTGAFTIGNISTGRRVSLITVEVITAFDGPATLSVGYQVNNPVPPPAEPDGLMVIGLTDLTVSDTYSTYTDLLFGIDTVTGDVTVTGTFDPAGSTVGEAQIIVSYV